MKFKTEKAALSEKIYTWTGLVCALAWNFLILTKGYIYSSEQEIFMPGWMPENIFAPLLQIFWPNLSQLYSMAILFGLMLVSALIAADFIRMVYQHCRVNEHIAEKDCWRLLTGVPSFLPPFAPFSTVIYFFIYYVKDGRWSDKAGRLRVRQPESAGAGAVLTDDVLQAATSEQSVGTICTDNYNRARSGVQHDDVGRAKEGGVEFSAGIFSRLLALTLTRQHMALAALLIFNVGIYLLAQFTYYIQMPVIPSGEFMPSWFLALMMIGTGIYVLVMLVWMDLENNAAVKRHCHRRCWKFFFYFLPFFSPAVYAVVRILPREHARWRAGRVPGHKTFFSIMSFNAAAYSLVWAALIFAPFSAAFSKRHVNLDNSKDYIGVVGQSYQLVVGAEMILSRQFDQSEEGVGRAKRYLLVFAEARAARINQFEYAQIQQIPAGTIVKVTGVRACSGCLFDQAVYYVVTVSGLELPRQNFEVHLCCGTLLNKRFANTVMVEDVHNAKMRFDSHYLQPLP